MKMRKIYNPKLEKYRKQHNYLTSTIEDGYMGVFQLRYKYLPNKRNLTIISTGPKLNTDDLSNDLYKWEHVSVSTPFGTPTWDEMCFIKDIFWSEEETVIQFHPPKSVYKNIHKYCLHLWKPIHFDVELPPLGAV